MYRIALLNVPWVPNFLDIRFLAERVSTASAFLSVSTICRSQITCLTMWETRRSNGSAQDLCYRFHVDIGSIIIIAL